MFNGGLPTMPGKSKPADTAAIVSEDAIRQRAYFMWEADGRPEGRGDHYWHLAHEEATRVLIDETTSRTAKATRGKNPSQMPAEVKAKAKPAKKAEARAVKKEPKPRAAVKAL